MTAGWIFASLVVPWAAGAGLVYHASDRYRSWLLTAGAGWLAGQVMASLLLGAALFLTGSSQARYLLVGLAVLGGVLWWRIVVNTLRRREQARRLSDGDGTDKPRSTSLHPACGVLLAVIAASLTLKLGTLMVSHALSPIRSDDAISIWLFKAKVVAVLDTLIVDEADPYYLGGSNPRYPLAVPLMAAWTPLVTGHWDEQQATWPWLGFYVSLIMLVAGGLRRWLTPSTGWVVAYIVASLPLMVVHAYRPGYADLPMAALLAATVLYLLTWRTTHLFRHLALAALFAVGAACTKREAPLIVGAAVFVILMASWRNLVALETRLRVALLGLMVVSVILVSAVVNVADVSDSVRSFTYNAEVWSSLGRHLLAWSSFGFLFYGLAVAGLLVLCHPMAVGHRWPALLLLLSLFVLDACAFLFTPQARFALNDQTPSRLFLQSIPAVILALAIPFGAMLGNGSHPPRR
jgi:hypothetical protein